MSQYPIQQAFNLALQHHQSGRLHEAEQLYRQILERQPEHVGALHYLGVLMHQQGQNDLAIDLIRSAVALNPNLPEAHNNLGLALKEHGQLDTAIAACRQAIALKPDYPAALFNLGVALHLMQQFDQAISAYRRAIALRPNYVEAHCNLGNALGCNGQVDEAVATLRRVIALRQSIAESGNPGSSSQGVDLARRVIIPPYLGEFGYKLLNHVRFVHELEADAKLVCCRRGEELLYPSATGFEYDWEDKVPDVERVSDGPQGKAPHRTGYTVVNPKYTYPIPWKTFRPVATAMLPTVDVAIGARNRGHDTERNWRHWAWLASKLRELDFTVGLVGHPETSQNFDVDVRPWEHPAGHTSGSVDLLSHCRVYVGTDTGTTHLAAFCDTPTVGFCRRGKFPELMFYAQAMNQSVFTRLPEAAWDDPKAVLDAVTASVSH